MKEILFILSTPIDSVYGASKSFRAHHELLKENYKFKVISQISVKSNKYSIAHTSLGVSVFRNVLGFDYNYRENAYSLVKFVCAIISLPVVIFKARSVDVIHLNSLTIIHYGALLKLFFRKKKIVCHVREVHTRFKSVTKYLSKFIDEFVFIDQSVKSSADVQIEAGNYFVLTNPIVSKPISKIVIPNNSEINIGIIGRIAPEKNVHEILNQIKSNKYESDSRVQFHFVGGSGADTDYFKNCLNQINSLENLTFYGEILDLENTNFYQALDGIIRFDDHYSVGRTILEALQFNLNIYTKNDIYSVLKNQISDLDSENFQSYECDSQFFKKKNNNGTNIHSIKKINNKYKQLFLQKIYA